MSLRHRRRRSLFFGGSDAYAVAGLNPNLVFDFAAELYRTSSLVSTFNDSLTYTGASAKTMVDSDGLLKWAPHNLLTYSEQFDNAAWTKSSVSVADLGDYWNIIPFSGSGNFSTSNESPPAILNTNMTQKLYVESNGCRYLQVVIGRQANRFVAAKIDLQTGVVATLAIGAIISANAEANGAGYDIEIIFSISSGGIGNKLLLYPSTTDFTMAVSPTVTGNGVDGVIVQYPHQYRSDLGGMVDNPDRGDSYVPTTSAAVYLPRRGHHIYNGSSWVNEGIQIESEARTNLVTYSEDFSNAAWVKSGATIDPDAATGPDGSTSADRLNVTAGGTIHQVFAYLSGYTTGDTVCNSVFAKADGGRYVAVTLYWSNSNYVSQVFDLSDGAKGDTNLGSTSGTLVSSGAENYGNGWWRLHVAATSGATTGNVFISVEASDSLTPTIVSTTGVPSFAAVAGEDYFIYGAQVEIGSTPSSYIPTAGATVTRAAETLTVAAANLPYSAVNMSMQMDGEMTYADEGVNSQETMVRWYSNGNDYIVIDVDTFSAATGEVNFRQKATALDLVITSSTYLSPGVNVSYNLASRHGATLLNGALDGTALTADLTPTTLPDLSATNMLLAYDYMGTIGKLRMWDADLGDTGIATASARTYTTEFAMIVATTTASETFTIPCRNVGTFNAGIDWGDGQVSTITAYNDAALTHTYAAAGDHVIRITGTFPNIYFNNGGDKLKVKAVENLGVVGWTSFTQGFYGCANMTSFTVGTTDTSAVTTINSIFRSCTNLTTLDLTNLDVSAVIDLSQTCSGCTGLTSVDVSNWDTSSATSMGSMFRGCTSLTTLDVSSFNTAAVTTMLWMFQGVQLASLDLSNFNTTLVTDMSNMFRDCTSLTALDVSNFNTALVTDMSLMFYSCTSLTDIVGVDTFDIGGLNSTGDLNNFATSVTLPTARYDALLLAWEAQDPFDGMSPNFGSSTYTGGGAVATAHASLISRDGWTITDGGVA